MPLRRIVVAIDGSEPADRALGLAAELARTSGGATLTLVSAISDPITVAPTPVAGLELVLEAEQQGAERDLAQRAERLRGQGLPVETVVQVGAAADVVAGVADATAADLVVAGSTGKGAIERALLGSVTTRLLHFLRRPLLVVP
ncbi:MAG TPA: universal stress protein [Myxococcaceae bacterium]|nr:universal stress protein [Myxococcaceae bacterium]